MTGQLRNPMSFVKEAVDAFRQGVKEAEVPAPNPQRLAMLQWVYIAKDKADRDEKIRLAYEKQRGFMGTLYNKSPAQGGIIKGIDIDGTPEDYAPTLVIGELEYVKERVLEFKELGFDDFIVKAHCGPDHRDILESLTKFGEHVMPLCAEEPVAADA